MILQDAKEILYRKRNSFLEPADWQMKPPCVDIWGEGSLVSFFLHCLSLWKKLVKGSPASVWENISLPSSIRRC